MDWEYIQNASGLMGKLMEKFVIENVKFTYNKWKRCKIQCRYTNLSTEMIARSVVQEIKAAVVQARSGVGLLKLLNVRKNHNRRHMI